MSKPPLRIVESPPPPADKPPSGRPTTLLLVLATMATVGMLAFAIAAFAGWRVAALYQ